MAKLKRIVLLSLIFVVGCRVFGAETADLTCPAATTLESLVACIDGQMPTKDSEGFVEPSAEVQADWRGVIQQMLRNDCGNVVLPSSLVTIYRVQTFVDADNGKSYCVLFEVLDGNVDGVVDRGWGTFIVHSQPRRPLSIQIAHPKFDLGTREQGIALFKQAEAHTFLMAGAHRNANAAVSSCQAAYKQADASHNVANLFHAAVAELVSYGDQLPWEMIALQFHAMGETSCTGVDVYLTYGEGNSPQMEEKVVGLRDNLRVANRTWVVTIPGDTPSCNLHGDINVQGRLYNGVSAVDLCTVGTDRYSGQFIHIEQRICCRDGVNWVQAIQDTWTAVHLPLVAKP